MSRATAGAQSPLFGEKLSKFIRPDAVLDLVVDNKEDLLRSLAEVAVEGASSETVEEILEGVLERENAVNTYVGNGVAIPQARVSCVDGFRLALARNPQGFPFGIDTDEPVVLAVLVVGNETMQKEHVLLLSAVAGLISEPEFRDQILAAKDAASVIRLLDSQSTPRRKARPLTQLLMSHAQKIAREMGVTAILVHVTSSEELDLLKRLPRRKKFIVATSSKQLAEKAETIVERVLRLPRVAFSPVSAVKLSALMALTHGLLEKGDVAAFLSGNNKKGIDTITVVEIGRGLGRVVTSGAVAPGVQPEVLERVITLAAELGAEGREGKPVGTLFVVVGDEEKLRPSMQQMVMNPFRGYPEEERNILDPTLAETIKEFAAIDGSFVVRGDGVMLSAGTFLKTDEDVELPGGYGSRHRAAASITKAVNCVSVVLSQSSGEVRVFKGGAEILSLERA